MEQRIKEGYKVIKDYPKYAVNESMEVINIKRGKPLKVNASGVVQLYNDIGDKIGFKPATLYYMTFFEDYKSIFLKEKQARVLYGYPNYAINAKGEVFQLEHFNQLKGCITGAGKYRYNTVTMRDKIGDPVTRPVAKLVAETFLQPVKDKCSVGFKDGNKLNVNLDNLYWK